jgi:hypothetical protein
MTDMVVIKSVVLKIATKSLIGVIPDQLLVWNMRQELSQKN